MLHVPVPEVYAWSATKANPVGSEYIIMGEATGTHASDSWEHMALQDQVAIMKDLILIETKQLSLSFTWLVLLCNQQKWQKTCLMD